MTKGRKINSKFFLVFLFAVLLISLTLKSRSNYPGSTNFYKALTPIVDTTIKGKPVAKGDSLVLDSLAIQPDSIRGKNSTPNDTTHADSIAKQTDTFHLKVSKDSLDAPIEYAAADSVVFDVPGKNHHTL